MKVKNIILTLFLIIGLLFLGGAVWSLSSSLALTKNGVAVTGTIIGLDVDVSEDNSKTYFPIIEFTTQDNQQVEFRSSMGSSSYRGSIGQQIEVLYEPLNPRSAVIDSTFGVYGASIIMGIFGVVFTLVGGIPTLISMLKKRNGIRLMREGLPIQVKITEVAENTMIQVNRRSPFQVIADVHDKDTNSIKRYKSENIYFDPSPYIDRETVTVYIDKQNPNKYHMDVSFLPKIK